MEIKFKGKMGIHQVIPNLLSILEEVYAKANLPEDGVVLVEDFSCKVVTRFNDSDNYLTVEREVNGELVPEMLSFLITLGENGEIKMTVDNEEESFFDETTIQQMLGKDKEYEAIESPYLEEELEELDSFSAEHNNRHLKSRLCRIKENGKGLLRYYVDDVLISESEVLPQFFEEMLKHNDNNIN